MIMSMRRVTVLLGVLGFLVLLAGVWRPAPVVAQASKAAYQFRDRKSVV